MNPDADQSALDAVSAVEDVLARERVAISRLDLGALEQLAQEKRAATDRLRGFLSDAAADGRRVRQALLALRGEAEANRALLDDAIGAIAEARGLYRDSGTYDSRARRRATYTARAGRGV